MNADRRARLEAYDEKQRRKIVAACEKLDGHWQEHIQRIKEETRPEYLEIIGQKTPQEPTG